MSSVFRSWFSVRSKIIFSVFLSLVAITGVNVWYTIKDNAFNSEEAEKASLAKDYDSYLNEYRHLEKTIAALTESLADRPDLILPFHEGNRSALLANLQPVFDRLHTSFHLSQLFIHESRGYVFLRVHQPDLYGDALISYREMLQDVITQTKAVSGVEIDPQSLGIRGVSPLFLNKQLIGFIELGITYDQVFLEELKKKLGTDFTIWISYAKAAPSGLWPTPEQTIAPTSTIFRYSQTTTFSGLAPATVYQAVLNDDTPRTVFIHHQDRDLAVFVAPLPGYNGQSIGLIEITRDRTQALSALSRQQIRALLASGAVALALLLAMWVLLYMAVIKPVQHLSTVAQEQINGNETARVNRFPNDEFGLLGSTFNTMADSLFAAIQARNNTIEDLEQAKRNLSRTLEERMKAQEALRKSEDNLRITLHSIGDAVIATDYSGKITHLNPVAERLTGWSQAAASGQLLSTVFDVFHEETKVPHHDRFDAVMKSGEIISLTGKVVLKSKSGEVRQIADSAAPIRDEMGVIVGMVLVFRDVTETRLLEEQLRQSQKMDVVGQLAGGIAHDFNNILAGIIGFSELILMRLPHPPHLEDDVKEILKAASRASDLTQKLLAFSRKGKVTSTPINVHEPIRSAISILKRTIDPRVKIEFHDKAANPTVVGDPGGLQNAFLNLAVNARDAMTEGGTLTFVTRNIFLDEAANKPGPDSLEPGNYLEIIVRDTGQGIPKEIQEKIFEPFFTTKPVGKGTGLGLAAVYGILKDHHGSITLQSEVGKGTEFRILLPSETIPSAIGSGPSETTVPGKGCILVVDDEPMVRSTTQLLLEHLGYDVLIAEDGLQALELFSQERHRISLVLLDMVMPKITGKETFFRLRQECPEIKVIFSSGFPRESGIDELIKQGGSGFIQKPYRQTTLSEVLAQALHPPPAP